MNPYESPQPIDYECEQSKWPEANVIHFVFTAFVVVFVWIASIACLMKAYSLDHWGWQDWVALCATWMTFAWSNAAALSGICLLIDHAIVSRENARELRRNS